MRERERERKREKYRAHARLGGFSRKAL